MKFKLPLDNNKEYIFTKWKDFTLAVFDRKNFENYYPNWICYPAYDNGAYASGLYTGWSTVYYSSGYSSNIESVLAVSGVYAT